MFVEARSTMSDPATEPISTITPPSSKSLIQMAIQTYLTEIHLMAGLEKAYIEPLLQLLTQDELNDEHTLQVIKRLTDRVVSQRKTDAHFAWYDACGFSSDD